MPAVAAAEIEHAFHFTLDLDLVVSKPLLNQPGAKTNDILIRIPVGHEITAVNGIPVLVGCAHSVIQVLIE